jgi:hypothetical protein
MFVCDRCHRQACLVMHVMITYTSCKVCRKETECVDCSFVRIPQPMKWEIKMYLHRDQIEYPRGNS